jgi:hypothetical protein
MATRRGAGGTFGLVVLVVLGLVLLTSELRSAGEAAGDAARLPILQVVAFPR